MWSLLLLLAGCAPVLTDDTPYVDEPRVLAVRPEPAEVVANSEVTLTALYADATGALSDAPVDWSFCGVPKPLAELGPVSPSCLDPQSEDLLPIGTGVAATGTVPTDTCSLFGPNPPPPVDGSVGGRPVDPDVTGGYYQPALGFDGDDPTLVSVRIRCGLANVSQETYVAWNLAYHSNTNPEVAELTVNGSGGVVDVPVDGSGEPPVVAPGESVTLDASWPECPAVAACGDAICSAGEDLSTCPDDCAEPIGCGGAEPYVVYDADAAVLVTRREAVSVTWFTTAGTLAEARNGRSGDEDEVAVSNTWTAPEVDGDAWFGVVVRDERGGVGFEGFRVRVGAR